MKDINAPHKFLIYSILQAIRHPRTPIIYGYCSECKMRVIPNSGDCPVCKKKLKENPETRKESPVPWWGAILCIIIGIGSWITGACLQVHGLDEAARALVYIPLGSLFGMSVKK